MGGRIAVLSGRADLTFGLSGLGMFAWCQIMVCNGRYMTPPGFVVGVLYRPETALPWMETVVFPGLTLLVAIGFLGGFISTMRSNRLDRRRDLGRLAVCAAIVIGCIIGIDRIYQCLFWQPATMAVTFEKAPYLNVWEYNRFAGTWLALVVQMQSLVEIWIAAAAIACIVFEISRPMSVLIGLSFLAAGTAGDLFDRVLYTHEYSMVIGTKSHFFAMNTSELLMLLGSVILLTHRLYVVKARLREVGAFCKL